MVLEKKLRSSLDGFSVARSRPASSDELYGRGAPDDQLFRRRRWNQCRHLPNHGQHQALVSIGKRGAEAFDFREETDFILRKLAKHFLRFAVARSLRAREKGREGDIHGFRNLG